MADKISKTTRHYLLMLALMLCSVLLSGCGGGESAPSALAEPAELQPEPQPDPQPHPVPKPEPKPDPKPDPEPEPEAQPQPAPKPDPEPEAQPAPKPQPSASNKYSALYGGSFYSGGQQMMAQLKRSGFTMLNFFTIHVDVDGNLSFNGDKLIENGVYVGRPEWPVEIASLKVAPTSINRIQFVLGSAGVADFENIEALINNQGAGNTTNLYRNFAALKEIIPEIDAIDFDDESNYDVDSTVDLALMLADIGYKISFVPYTAQSYWQQAYKRINDVKPGTVDIVQVQAYAGGSGNQPQDWNTLFDGIQVSMGLWSKHGTQCTNGDSSASVNMAFENWQGEVAGGFMWLYDDISICNGNSGAAEYAAAINSALDIEQSSTSNTDSPSPRSGSTFVATDVNLTWQAGFGAVGYQVYMATQPNLNSEHKVAEVEVTRFLPEHLQQSTSYYWRVDSVFADDTVLTGDLWNFTTAIDGIELVDRTDGDMIVTARGQNLPNEGLDKLTDNRSQTKWLDFVNSSHIEFEFSTSFVLQQYSITSANDAPERDPKDWTVYGSKDGLNWTAIDARQQQDFTLRFEKRVYDLSPDTAYRFYRFELANNASNIIQIAEMELFEFVSVE